MSDTNIITALQHLNAYNQQHPDTPFPNEDYQALAAQPLNSIIQTLTDAKLPENQYRELLAFTVLQLRKERWPRPVERTKEEFAALRQRLGVSQQWLADRLHVSVATVRRWEDTSTSYRPGEDAWELLDETDRCEWNMARKAVDARIGNVLKRRRELGDSYSYWFGRDAAETISLGLHYYRDEADFRKDIERYYLPDGEKPDIRDMEYLESKTGENLYLKAEYGLDTSPRFENSWSVFPESDSYMVQNAITNRIIDLVQQHTYQPADVDVRITFDRHANGVLPLEEVGEKEPYWADTHTTMFYGPLAGNPDKLQLGYGLDDMPVVWDLQSDANLLIIGKQRSGKTQLMQNLVCQSIMKDHQVLIADFTPSEANYRWADGHVAAKVHDMDGLHRVLDWLMTEANSRAKVLKELGLSDVSQLAEPRFKRILLAIDGLDSYFDRFVAFARTQHDKLVNAQLFKNIEQLRKLVEYGHMFGIHIAACGKTLGRNLMTDKFPYKRFQPVLMKDTMPETIQLEYDVRGVAELQRSLDYGNAWNVGKGLLLPAGGDPIPFTTNSNSGFLSYKYEMDRLKTVEPVELPELDSWSQVGE